MIPITSSQEPKKILRNPLSTVKGPNNFVNRIGEMDKFNLEFVKETSKEIQRTFSFYGDLVCTTFSFTSQRMVCILWFDWNKILNLTMLYTYVGLGLCTELGYTMCMQEVNPASTPSLQCQMLKSFFIPSSQGDPMHFFFLGYGT